MSVTIKFSSKIAVVTRLITFPCTDRHPFTFAQVDVFGKFKVFAGKHNLGISVGHIMC